MKKYRLGVVGQGGRGRGMFRWFSENFEDIEPVAACDIVPKFWYETKENDMTMAERMPQVAFYEDFDEMMAKTDLDILMVETPATNHADFCEKGLKAGVHSGVTGSLESHHQLSTPYFERPCFVCFQ